MPAPESRPRTERAPLRYAVISVVKNEEAYLPRTVASMLSQTRRPEAWIVVDDGSTDRTPEILAEAAGAHPWITVLRDEGTGERNPSFATARGFNRALPRVRELPVEAIAKLDGDMEFAADYFERLLDAMAADPRLGIVGGRALEPHADGSWGLVRISPHHVHGATQIFRREVLEAQGGLTLGVGEDTVTIIRARLAGWTTRSLPDVVFHHLRVTGSAGGRLRAQRAKGRAAYRVGYHPVFAVLRALRNAVRRPYLASGAAFLQGFVSGYREHAPRALSPEEIRAFRAEQRRALLGRRSWWR